VKALARLRVDPYVLLLLATVGVACLVPARGGGADVLDVVTTVAIGALFFLYGTRLSPREALDGVRHWRLHLTVPAATFAVFPLLGLAAWPLREHGLGAELYTGLLYLTVLPSTVQSSISFVSIARGNVPGAIAAATFSNLLGVLVTPLLVLALLDGDGVSVSGSAVVGIGLQLLAPFAAGQVLRRWVGPFVTRHRRIIGFADRGAILLVVYAAFGEGMEAGIWGRVSGSAWVVLGLAVVVLLAAMLGITSAGSRLLGFSREDRVTIVFCGSKKSMASGLPMASVLFAGQDAALLVLPLMVFHQLQLIVCAVIAPRWARRVPVAGRESEAELVH
jgi:sodium/bile acid cotransporter 7